MSRTSEPSPGSPSPASVRSCPPFVESTVTGTVEDLELDEISGIAVGHRMRGILWAVEDSGNEAAVFALEPTGEVVAKVAVDGARNEDWEELAWASGRLYIGDIGDNEQERSKIRVYILREPTDRGIKSADARLLRLRYEDGPHDAEALFVDPRDQQLYIIVKQLTEPASAMYAVSLDDLRPGEVGELRFVASVPLSTVTAAALGPAGIAVRNYETVLLFPWSEDRTVVSTLGGASCPVSLGSSEAITQTLDGSAMYSIREGIRPSVRFAEL